MTLIQKMKREIQIKIERGEIMKKMSFAVAKVVESAAINAGMKSASLWSFHQPRQPKIK